MEGSGGRDGWQRWVAEMGGRDGWQRVVAEQVAWDEAELTRTQSRRYPTYHALRRRACVPALSLRVFPRCAAGAQPANTYPVSRPPISTATAAAPTRHPLLPARTCSAHMLMNSGATSSRPTSMMSCWPGRHCCVYIRPVRACVCGVGMGIPA